MCERKGGDEGEIMVFSLAKFQNFPETHLDKGKLAEIKMFLSLCVVFEVGKCVCRSESRAGRPGRGRAGGGGGGRLRNYHSKVMCMSDCFPTLVTFGNSSTSLLFMSFQEGNSWEIC